MDTQRITELEKHSKKMRYWKYQDSPILFGEVALDAELNLDDAIENEQVRYSMLDPKNPVPYVLNIRNIYKISREAREYSSRSTDGISSIAMVIDSGVSRVIANYALLINRPVIPTKIFNDMVEAEKWASQFIQGRG